MAYNNNFGAGFIGFIVGALASSMTIILLQIYKVIPVFEKFWYDDDQNPCQYRKQSIEKRGGGFRYGAKGAAVDLPGYCYE